MHPPTAFDFAITRQPNEVTCGPACLHAIYRHYGDDIDLDTLCNEVKPLAHGGTLAVMLALHALRRGYKTTIYTCNLLLFDPTWFAPDGPPIRDRLVEQMKHKPDDVNLQVGSRAYLDYLDLGGALRMEDVTLDLLDRCIGSSTPVVAGLSATWLYRCAREREDDYVSDDVAGLPLGHFVVLHGIDAGRRLVRVADPYRNVPYPDSHHYQVDVDRLIAAILLGIVTYDAKLLIIEPGENGK
ncbi:MAG: cysteine peptidase family C39 domain-containing protein [Phycisphaeraceae bacterium]